MRRRGSPGIFRRVHPIKHFCYLAGICSEDSRGGEERGGKNERRGCWKKEKWRRRREGEGGWKRERDVVWGTQELLACKRARRRHLLLSQSTLLSVSILSILPTSPSLFPSLSFLLFPFLLACSSNRVFPLILFFLSFVYIPWFSDISRGKELNARSG